MKERFQFLFLYYFFWLIYFISARLIFLIYHIQDTKVLTLELIYGIFQHGILMDLSMSAYLSVIPFLLVTFSNYIKKSRLESALFGYTLTAVFILTLIVVVDLEVYNVWKFRLDKTPLRYLASPREAFASAKSSPIFQLFLSYLALIAIASYIVYRIISKRLDDWKHIEPFPFVMLSLLLTATLIIPMRGGLRGEPLKPGQLYFSENYFANVSTLNAPWNFIYSMKKSIDTKINPYTYLPRNEINRSLDELFPVRNALTAGNLLVAGRSKPNVLIVVVESLSEKLLNHEVEGKPLTPFLNKFIREGCYFTNTYAAGDHTEKGLVALLNGYPANPTNSIIYDTQKLEKLPFLAKKFDELNYSTEFYYGGDASFLNLNNYLLVSDFQRSYDATAFPATEQLSDWGVYDNALFERFVANHRDTTTKPFFSTILTVSSHEPFDVPQENPFSEQNVETDFYTSILYTDQVLQKFIEKARQQWWWQNTLLVIVADHGHRYPVADSRFDDYRIPLLFAGGAVQKNKTFSTLTNQTDLPKIILDELKLPADEFTWSKNPLNPKQMPWSFFTFNDGFGYLENDRRLLFDNVGRKALDIESAENQKKMLRRGKSLQQSTYDDYLEK